MTSLLKFRTVCLILASLDVLIFYVCFMTAIVLVYALFINCFPLVGCNLIESVLLWPQLCHIVLSDLGDKDNVERC